MQVWQFTGASLTQALTLHETGDNLPEDLGPWKLVRSTFVEGDGLDAVEARRLITEHGYVCFD